MGLHLCKVSLRGPSLMPLGLSHPRSLSRAAGVETTCHVRGVVRPAIEGFEATTAEEEEEGKAMNAEGAPAAEAARATAVDEEEMKAPGEAGAGAGAGAAEGRGSWTQISVGMGPKIK